MIHGELPPPSTRGWMVADQKDGQSRRDGPTAGPSRGSPRLGEVVKFVQLQWVSGLDNFRALHLSASAMSQDVDQACERVADAEPCPLTLYYCLSKDVRPTCGEHDPALLALDDPANAARRVRRSSNLAATGARPRSRGPAEDIRSPARSAAIVRYSGS
jgi:hypothetical protein